MTLQRRLKTDPDGQFPSLPSQCPGRDRMREYHRRDATKGLEPPRALMPASAS